MDLCALDKRTAAISSVHENELVRPKTRTTKGVPIAGESLQNRCL